MQTTLRLGPELSKPTTKARKAAPKKSTAKPKKVPKVKAGAELGKPINKRTAPKKSSPKAKKVKKFKAPAELSDKVK